MSYTSETTKKVWTVKLTSKVDKSEKTLNIGARTVYAALSKTAKYLRMKKLKTTEIVSITCLVVIDY